MGAKPMEQINIHEAKTHFSKLIQRVLCGEEIVIARSGQPVARLCPVDLKKRRPREPGSAKGLVKIHDDFDAPLPDTISSAFRGEGG